jgi:exopolysaccharide production protein ExoZ
LYRETNVTEPAHPRTIIPIQILRAVAALAIVVLHVGFYLAPLTDPANSLPDFSVGDAGIDLFFVISGFVMVYASEHLFAQPNGPLIFFTHRLIRIVPLYWIVTTLYLAISLTVPDFLKNYPAAVVAASYFFVPVPRPDGTMQPIVGLGWTLNYEMLFYLIFALAVCAPRRVGAIGAALVLLVIVILGRLCHPLPATLDFWSDPILIEFVFGMLIGLCYREGLKLPQSLALTLIAGGFLLFFIDWHVAGLTHRAVIWGIPASLVVAGASLGRFSAAGLMWRPLVIIGNASYALYLLHVIPVRSIIFFARRADIDLSRIPWVYFAVSVFSAVALAIAVHYLFERPVTQALRRRAVFGRLPKPRHVVDFRNDRRASAVPLAIPTGQDKLSP